MKQNAKYLGHTFFILLLLITPSQILEFRENDVEASTKQSNNLTQILEKRQNFLNRVSGRNVDKLVSILIVPGHDDEHWGAEFNGLKEVELNRALAQKMYEYLSNEKGINAVLASDESGYNPIFETYFKREENKIEKFIKDSKKTFSKKIDTGKVSYTDSVFHNAAPGEVAYKLYGINRWANTQKFDLIIHVHFNDYSGRRWNKAGEHDGFSIYTPGALFDNHDLSRIFADSVFKELKKIRPVSSLEGEKTGVVEDHELIALGANETLDAGVILVEYGYIYESVFSNPITRETALDYLAYSTYAGIKDMLKEIPQEKENLQVQITKNKTSKNNLVWQFQKALAGNYPPKGKSLRDCPIMGYFGECSRKVE